VFSIKDTLYRMARDSLLEYCVRAKKPRGGYIVKRYETILIVLADLPSEELQGLTDRYLELIASLHGVVVKVDNWGKRKLAYSIKKREHGHYLLIDHVADHALITEFERLLKYDESVLRYQTVKTSDKVDMEAIEQEIAAAKEKEQKAMAEVSSEEEKPQEQVSEQGEQEAAPAAEESQDEVKEEISEEKVSEDEGEKGVEE